MNDTAAVSSNPSLNALRGAVGGVVGAGDAVSCWDQLVWIWRIMRALDGLISVLWAIVHRLRAGEIPLGGVCPAGAMAATDCGERPVVVGSGLVRRRAVARVQAMPGRRVLTGAVASAGWAQRCERPQVDWGRRDQVWAGMSPVLGARGGRFSEPGWGGSRSCVLIVTVKKLNWKGPPHPAARPRSRLRYAQRVRRGFALDTPRRLRLPHLHSMKTGEAHHDR